MEEGVTSAAPGPLPSQKALEMLEGSLPPALPEEGSVPHTPALRKGLPSLKQLNSARRQLRPLATPTTLQRLGSPASATPKPRVPGDPEQPTAPAPLQIVPFTTLVTTLLNSPEPAQAPDDSSPGSPQDKGDNELTGSASEESQETTTSTIITTTIITTEQAPGRPHSPPTLAFHRGRGIAALLLEGEQATAPAILFLCCERVCVCVCPRVPWE